MKSIPTFTLAFAFAIAHKLYSNYVFKLSPYVVTAFAVFLLSIFAGIRRKAVSGVGCRSPPANLDFQKNSDWQAVKYAPRKVYIKESGSYTELSYKEFYNRRETDRAYADKLFIPVQGCLIETEQAHYIEFYRDKERWRYLKKLDADNSLLSLEAFEGDDDNSIDFIADEAVNVAETVVHRMMLDKLRFTSLFPLEK